MSIALGQQASANDILTANYAIAKHELVMPRAQLRGNAALAVATSTSTWTTISGYGSIIYRKELRIDPGAGVIWITKPGVYAITGGAAFAANATGLRLIRLGVTLDNGPTTLVLAEAMFPATATFDTWLNVSTTYFLEAGAKIENQVIQNSGGNLNVLASSAILAVDWLDRRD